MEKLKKLIQNRMLRSVVFTVVGTAIYCFGIVFVLDKSISHTKL